MRNVLIADLLALALMAFFAWRGYRRGILVCAISLGGAVLGYAAAFLLSGFLGQRLAGVVDWPAMHCRLVAGIVVFAVISMVTRLSVRGMIKRRRAEERDGKRDPLGGLSRLGGAVSGAVMALLAVVLIHWVYALARGAEPETPLPDVAAGAGGSFSRAVVQAAAATAMNNDVARMVSRPDESANRLRDFLALDSVNTLIADEDFREALLDGDEQAVAENPSYVAVFEDPEAVEALRQVGALAGDDQEAREDLARRLAEIGRRLRDALETPEVAAAVAGLREDGLLERQNWPRLVMDPRFAQIVQKVAATQKEKP